MQTRKLIPELVIVSVVAIALAVVAVQQGATVHNLKNRWTFLRSDQPFVEAAERIWTGHSHETREMIERDRYPVVMHIGSEVCVELRLYFPGVGGNPIYCFDSATTKLTRKFDRVE